MASDVEVDTTGLLVVLAGVVWVIFTAGVEVCLVVVLACFVEVTTGEVLLWTLKTFALRWQHQHGWHGLPP